MTTTTTFKNPIISGFAPDPSVVQVNDTFFLVNSSFHIFPGLPIYASKDLNSWRHIGNAVNRSDQIDLSEATTDSFPMSSDTHLYAALGLFAPTIRWHKGTFYIVCTNMRRDKMGDLVTDNFYITCEDIWANQWSDPIWFDFNGIDPSFFFDDDGRAYVQGSWREGSISDQTCTIRQFEIDPSCGEPLSDIRVVWGHDGKKSDIEGPHMYKKDGYYYLLVADGGTFEHHKARIARSRNIWGPFEVYENNPVLTAAGLDSHIQHVGHADLFQDTSRRWWAVALGVRKVDGAFPMGRETFLIPIDWEEAQWPNVGQAQMQFDRGSSPLADHQKTFSIDQNSRVDDVFIRNANLEDYKFSADGKSVTIIPRTNSMSAPKGSTSFIGKRQRSQTCTASTTLYIPEGGTTTAGIALYKDDCRHIELSYDTNTRSVTLVSCFKATGSPQILGERPVTTTSLQMKITATSKLYEFWTREENDLDWVSLGSVNTLEMTGYDFTGTIFGIWTCTTAPAEAKPVRFEVLDVLERAEDE